MKNVQRLLVGLVILSLCAATLPFSARAEADTILVRLPAEAYTDRIPAVQALDYDSFVWLELTAADFARLQASGLPHQAYSDPFTLRLGEQSFDTRQGGPILPEGWTSANEESPDLHLVQFVGPTRAEWLDHLQSSGLEIVQYIYPFTYIVWGGADTLNSVLAESFVQWTGSFAPAFRVQPRWQNLPDEPVQVSVLLVRNADTQGVLRRLELLGAQTSGKTVLNHIFEIADLTISGAQLQAAAGIPGVYSIQVEPNDGGLRGEMSNQINVNNHDGSNLAFPGYFDWLASVGLDGSGVIMANVDSGVDQTHPDLVNRIIPCSGQTCGGSASSSHGTHTAGIMAADAASGTVDPRGFLRGLGMAPGADLVEQVYNPWFTQPGGMLLLMTDSYNNGAALSGNSWGPSGSPQGYDDDTMQVDIGVRDADPNVAGNQPLNYILSFMNGYGGYQTQGTPDEAKNIFTIGSTKMQNSDGSQILDINDLSSNSAHGPALDGRTIPHMVAPGCRVDSTVPGASYGTMCGTSMSSPHVSGAVALFIEYYRNLYGVDPSAALVKAAFLPVAHDLEGYDDADGSPLGHPFDSKQGWGRLDAEAVISPTLPILYLDNPTIFDNTGEEWVQTLSAADPSEPVRMMLVWTDAPGHGLGGSTPAWNNDLDLVVEVGGDTYYGNDFGPDGWSQTGALADGMNNTEGVFLGPSAPADFSVRVIASNINSDGIPNQGDATDQDFGLVCYNCLAEPDFSLSVDPDAFSICVPDMVTSTIQVGEILTYPYPVSLNLLHLPTGVTASISPTTVIPPGQAELSLDAGPSSLDGSYTLVLSGTAQVTNVHTAEIDLLLASSSPDSPSLLSPADGAMDQPYQNLSFDWSDLPLVSSYNFQLDSDPSFLAPLVDASSIPTSTFTLDSPLDLASCFFWRAGAENACGVGDWAEPFRFATVALGLSFSDDMEAGAGEWSHQADQGTDSWTLSTDQSHSPTHSWHVPDANSVTDSFLWNSSSVHLGAGSSLSFWHRHQFESSYDGSVLEISTNGGSAWTDLGPYITANGYNGTLSTCCGNPLGGRSAWVSDLSEWTQVEVDLNSFAGQDVLIRWRIGCDSSVGDVGWYIDDVMITSPLPPNPAPTLSGIYPSSGSPLAETPVQIRGSGFITTPFASLGDTWLMSVTVISSTTLNAVVPAGMAMGTYTLTLINGDCQMETLPEAFTVRAAMEIYLPVLFKN